MCHRAGVVPVHRRTSFAPLLSLPARSQRSRDRPLHPVDRVVEWMHRPRSLLHGLRRSSPLHRAYRVNSPANATRHKQPGQKSHPPALPRKRTPSTAAPCYADASIRQEVDVSRPITWCRSLISCGWQHRMYQVALGRLRQDSRPYLSAVRRCRHGVCSGPVPAGRFA